MSWDHFPNTKAVSHLWTDHCASYLQTSLRPHTALGTHRTHPVSHFPQSSKAIPVVSGQGRLQSLHSWLDLQVIFTFCRTRISIALNWTDLNRSLWGYHSRLKNRGTNKVKDPSDLNKRTWIWTRRLELTSSSSPSEDQDMHHPTVGSRKLHSYYQRQDRAAPHPGCRQEFWECQRNVQQPPGWLVSGSCMRNSGLCSRVVTALFAG